MYNHGEGPMDRLQLYSALDLLQHPVYVLLPAAEEGVEPPPVHHARAAGEGQRQVQQQHHLHLRPWWVCGICICNNVCPPPPCRTGGRCCRRGRADSPPRRRGRTRSSTSCTAPAAAERYTVEVIIDAIVHCFTTYIFLHIFGFHSFE